ncbi:MAG: alpha-amylase [Clostridia bacterium]|nr:alpha-amylase [Clostridia bacterium]
MQSVAHKSFWIPSIWNTIGYKDVLDQKNGEISVNPYAFIKACIDYILDGEKSGLFHENNDLSKSVIYNSLVRYSTAWDYNDDGKIESGTFLRTIILLPMLKNYGVDILYVLPVTKYSTLNQKGDIGSPYAIQNYFELDPNLHDDLLDGMVDFDIKREFAALIEACHLMGIKVVHDFIPRVTARNSDLIEKHPDWVYWIKIEHIEGFKPPEIPELGFFEECTPEKIDIIYNSCETAVHLEKFSHSPDKLNPELWERIKQMSRETGEDLLTLVELEMKITTSPAHSDWINDVQPIWTDTTFLRLFMDVTPSVQKYLKADQAPYIMFDTIKGNIFPAGIPNQGLWDIFEEVLRHDMEVYGLDGFRVDIGHTLPVPLLQHLFNVVKKIKPDAILISEDLFNSNHKKAKSSGYNIMLGSGWNIMSKISKKTLVDYLKELPSLEINIFACAETADTPRITSRNGGINLARMMGVFNYFLPNAVPYITTGFEVNEKQPLNCGLADNTNGAEIPRAFFNKIKIDWTNQYAEDMNLLLRRLYSIRKEYLGLIKPDNFTIPETPEDIIIYAYVQKQKMLVCCFNLNMDNEINVNLEKVFSGIKELRILADTHLNSIDKKLTDCIVLKPGQAIVAVKY